MQSATKNQDCPHCSGMGVIIDVRGKRKVTTAEIKCPRCRGTGAA